MAFGVKHGGKQVPKIDFSTRLVYLQCTVWVDAAVYFPSLPFFLSHPCFLVTDERVRCALFVHRNINHSICLVCISENFHVSLLPNHDRRSTAERTYRQYAACFECSYSSSHAEKARAGGCGTCSMCWPLKKEIAGRKEIALVSVSCFLQIATSESRCGPRINWPCGQMFQFLFRYVYCHHGSKDHPCFPAFLTIPVFCVCPPMPTFRNFAHMSSKCWQYYLVTILEKSFWGIFTLPLTGLCVLLMLV